MPGMLWRHFNFGQRVAGAQPLLFQVANLSEASLPHSESSPNPKTDRTPFRLLRDVDGIAFAYQNDSMHYDGSVSGYAPFTVKPTLELLDGTLIPITFKGARSITIPTGGEVVSDFIPRRLTKGRFFHRVCLSSSGGTAWPCTQRIGTQANGSGSFAGDAADSQPGSAFTTQSLFYAPSAILGAASKAGTRILEVGDSITVGFQDNSAILNVDGDASGYSRAFTANGIPHTKISVSGMNESYIASAGVIALMKRVAATNKSTHIFTNLSINNLSPNVANWKTQALAMWDAMAQTGLPIIQTTIGMWATSTDGWTTLENQTVIEGAARNEYNAWLKTKPHSGLLAVLDVCPAIESSPESGKWIPGMAWDDLHPNTAGHDAIKALVQSQMVALGLA